MKIEKVEKTWMHRIIEFNQKPWLKLYIDLNRVLKNENNDFKNNFCKLLSNAVYGKNMEKLRKPRYTKLVTNKA